MIFLQNNTKQNKKLSHAEISSLTEAHLQSLEFHLSNLQQAITAISLTGRKDCQRLLSFGFREAMDTNEIFLDCLNFAT